jgi:glycosyltransferase EpsD
MGKKILFVASIGQHLLRFHMPTISWLIGQGHQVHAACSHADELSSVMQVHQINFERQPFSINNIKAYFQLKKLIKEEKFEIIHCHTAVASVISRLAAISFRKKNGLNVIYTAHGFHFYKGCPWFYWALYYPVELFCSRFLDCQITINDEDFNLALEKFHCKNVRKISGMGVNGSRFVPLSDGQKQEVRKEFSLPANSKILVYVAEFISRKNHDFIIEVSSILKAKIPDLVIILPGRGRLLNTIKEKVESLGLQNTVLFPGFRKDIENIVGFSDIAISASRQEGLGMNLIEALMCGIPVVASNNRGHREIIRHDVNGFLFDYKNQNEFIDYISKLLLNDTLYKTISGNARGSVQRFELELSLQEIQAIYKDYL